MEMCYQGGLIMPSSFAVMSEEEMTYLDGGVSTTFYVNPDRVSTLYTAILGAAGATAAVWAKLSLATIKTKIVALATKIATAIKALAASALGIVGIVLATIGASVLAANIGSFGLGIATAGRKSTGVQMTWYGAAFANFSYY